MIIRYDLCFATLTNSVEGIFKKDENSLCKYICICIYDRSISIWVYSGYIWDWSCLISPFLFDRDKFIFLVKSRLTYSICTIVTGLFYLHMIDVYYLSLRSTYYPRLNHACSIPFVSRRDLPNLIWLTIYIYILYLILRMEYSYFSREKELDEQKCLP